MQPQAPAWFASVTNLGALKGNYTPTYQARRSRIIWNTAWVVIGLALFAGGLIWISVSATMSSGAGTMAFLPICFGFLFMPAGLYGLWGNWRTWNKGAALFENGFAYTEGHGIQPVAWNDIDAVFENVVKHYRNGSYAGTVYKYTVLTRDKRRLVLDNDLPGIEQLGNEILRGSSVALFPAYWQALQNGQRLNFGPLAIDRNGIYTGSKSLPWSEIKAIRIYQGQIGVKKESGWFNWASVSVRQIPNFYIFYDLVKRFTTVE